MKKNIIIILMILVLSMALAACESSVAPVVTGAVLNEDGTLTVMFTDGTTQTVMDPAGIKDAATLVKDAVFSFDGDKNLIITHPDGSRTNLGKNALGEYTVTFTDYDGRILSTETTFRGLSVLAPADPARENYDFAGWDKDFSAVTEDMVVKAVYNAKETFTVTFVDHDGKVLKTETVVIGNSATAPADPTRDGYNFTGWAGDYTNVTSNVVIQATYAAKGTYRVTFVDYNGLILDVVEVKEGENATASVTPTRDGYTFKGWSSSLSNITANMTVSAQYVLIAASNVFDISYTVSGKTVTLVLSLVGDVKLAGFEGTLVFEGMTATAVTSNSANALAYLKKDGVVSFAYTSATDVTNHEKLFTVTLTATAKEGASVLTLTDCFDQNFDAVSYTVIGERIKLESEVVVK